MFARRFHCSAKEVLAFATGCARKNEGIGSACSRQEHEMEIGEDVYFYDGTKRGIPTAYCASMDCFLGDLDESTIFHELGKKLTAGMQVCLTCKHKSNIDGGMAQCQDEGHKIKTYKTKKEYERESGGDEDEETHTFHAYQILGRQKFATLWDTEEVLYYEDGVYRRHGETLIKVMTEERVENCTSHMRNEVIGTIRAVTTAKRDRFDSLPGVVNVKNGMLDVSTMQLAGHDAAHLSRVQLDAKYDPSAVATGFLRFLAEVIPSASDRLTLLELLGTALVGNFCNTEKILMFLGEGHNGKSTLLDVISSVIGEDNISHVSIHQIINERFARAELEGKLVNIYADISGEEITNLGVIKSLVSGEPVMAEYKGQPAFALKNRAKLVFSANRLPDIAEDSDAVFRRFVIIHFPVQFDGARDNPNLKKELTTEAEKSGILNILVRSLRLVMRQNGRLTNSRTIDEMRNAWRVQSDHVKKFTVVCLKRDDGHHEDKEDVYQAYVLYCKHVNERPEDKTKFSRRMSSLGYRYQKVRIRGRAVNAWSDVRLGSPEGAEKEGGGGGGGAGGGGGGAGSASDGGAASGGGLTAVEKDLAGVMVRASEGGEGRGIPGGRKGIVLDILRTMCADSKEGAVERTALEGELRKTGLFQKAVEAENIINGLVADGWLSCSGGGGDGVEGGGNKSNDGVSGVGSSGDGSGGDGGVAGTPNAPAAPATAAGQASAAPAGAAAPAPAGAAAPAAAGAAGAAAAGAAGAAAAGQASAAPAGAAGAAAAGQASAAPAGAAGAAKAAARRFRCLSCPAGPYLEGEVGFGGRRILEYHSKNGHRIEWLD